MKELTHIKKQLDDLAEKSWEETQTTAFIETTIPLKPIKKGFLHKPTGLVYKIGQGENAILLRADIDALEGKNGPRHTCGHSSHTAALMQTLLERISEEKDLTKQNKAVYFLFQPSEEWYPSGAQTFVKECPEIIQQVQYAFTAHVKPLAPLGMIGLQTGAVWSKFDYITLEIHGKMVHVKDIPLGIDALETAAHLILFIKTLQKQFGDKIRINTGTINGGLQSNTVADYAKLEIELRMQDVSYQPQIKKLLVEKITQLEKKFGSKVKLIYGDGYPVVKNDEALTQDLTNHFRQSHAFTDIQTQDQFSFGTEDFSFISEKVPSVYAFIGTGDTFDIHQPECTISNLGTKALYTYFTEIISWWMKSK